MALLRETWPGELPALALVPGQDHRPLRGTCWGPGAVPFAMRPRHAPRALPALVLSGQTQLGL